MFRQCIGQQQNETAQTPPMPPSSSTQIGDAIPAFYRGAFRMWKDTNLVVELGSDGVYEFRYLKSDQKVVAFGIDDVKKLKIGDVNANTKLIKVHAIVNNKEIHLRVHCPKMDAAHLLSMMLACDQSSFELESITASVSAETASEKISIDEDCSTAHSTLFSDDVIMPEPLIVEMSNLNVGESVTDVKQDDAMSIELSEEIVNAIEQLLAGSASLNHEPLPININHEMQDNGSEARAFVASVRRFDNNILINGVLTENNSKDQPPLFMSTATYKSKIKPVKPDAVALLFTAVLDDWHITEIKKQMTNLSERITIHLGSNNLLYYEEVSKEDSVADSQLAKQRRHNWMPYAKTPIKHRYSNIVPDI